MTIKEKASAALEIMEEWDSDTIVDVLTSYIKDEDLAEIYDKMVSEGII